MSRDRDDYWGDVVYEVWRSGGDVDRIDDDRVEDSRWDGLQYEQAARIELQHQRPPEPQYEPLECCQFCGPGGPCTCDEPR